MICKGRTKLLTEYKSVDVLDITTMASIVNVALAEHYLNKADIDYLVDYRNGTQTILEKEKDVRPEVNNKLVINHAQMVTRLIIGYFLGTPIQYIQNGDTTKKTQIDELNKYVQYEDKASVDKEIGDFQSICGTAYRIVYTDGALGDEVPFEEKCLNPATTFIVYENSISEKPVLGVTYYDVYNDVGEKIAMRLYVYTEYGMYDVKTGTSLWIDEDSTINFNPYSVGGVPIIEYPNNVWRIGDWELCIGLMDAINSLHSGRLDDIDQIVQSLIVFINAEVDDQRYDEMRDAGIVSLKNTTGNPSSVQTINNALEQTGMNQFATELESLLYAMLSIPDRNNRAGGGGDTGQAVELRDGWADLEIVARNKELVFKKSEKQTLRIILKIMQNTLGFDLSMLDIDIKFSRNKSNNLLVKVQAYQGLLTTKTLSPADCLTIVDLVSDVNEYISRGETFWGDSFAGLVQAETTLENSRVALENLKSNPTPENSANAADAKNADDSTAANGKIVEREKKTK